MTWLMYLLCHLPIWIVGISTAILVMRATLETRRSKEFILYSIGSILILILILFIMDFRIYLPTQFIPTKWSDLDFYVHKLAEINTSIKNISTSMLTPKDLLRSLILIKCLLCVLANLFLIILVKLRLSTKL